MKTRVSYWLNIDLHTSIKKNVSIMMLTGMFNTSSEHPKHIFGKICHGF